MKTQLREILFNNNNFIPNRFRDGFFKKFHPFLYEKIQGLIVEDYSFKEKIYIIYYGIDKPVCGVCGEKTKLISFSKGFTKYCSKQCIQKDDVVRKKVRDTFIKNYGVDNPNKNSDVMNKRKNTIRKKYGVDWVFQSEEIKDKIKQTNLDNYGTENPFQSEEIKDKIKQTNLDKYGVEHNSRSKNVVKKRKKTFIKNYGVDNPNKNPDIIEKRNKTIVLNYIKKYSKILCIGEDNILTTTNGDVIIEDMCPIHNKFKIDKQNLFNRIRYNIENICTRCNPIAETPTIKEKEIVKFIDDLNIRYVRNDRKILKGKEIDILMSDNKIGIEFNGLYWHSSKYCNKTYHLNKTDDCEANNIQLLHIFEDEWIFKKNIVKSIIKSKLGIFDERIFARKCKIREINNMLVRKFLDENHIQGKINSGINVGLFYNDELVSLMTFGMKRIALGNKMRSGDEYEMLRYCNKLNTQIIGGASRLFNYFIKQYKPKEILSFADRRYFNGKLYSMLNFNFIGKTKPNYWYFKKNELIRYHRYNFRKDVLVKNGFDSNMTEFEIMEERKYYRIYDCGSLKYLWVK